MAIHVKCRKFDPEAGQYQYHLQFKPVVDDDDVRSSVAVEVAFSISENGELADLSFMVPKAIRNDDAMKYLKAEETTQYVDPRVFISLPQKSGDTVLRAPADLHLDSAGRIVGIEIH